MRILTIVCKLGETAIVAWAAMYQDFHAARHHSHQICRDTQPLLRKEEYPSTQQSDRYPIHLEHLPSHQEEISGAAQLGHETCCLFPAKTFYLLHCRPYKEAFLCAEKDCETQDVCQIAVIYNLGDWHQFALKASGWCDFFWKKNVWQRLDAWEES